MKYTEILYDVVDPVATITLNRPERLNAWTSRMGFEVRHAVNAAHHDTSVVGIVLTGAGRAFCAGADMGLLERMAEDEPSRPLQITDDIEVGEPGWGDDLQGTHTFLMSVPKPIIAAINGPIAGMAIPIALSCDLRFMAPDAILTTSFAERGTVAEWGSSWLLPRAIGPAAALDLLFSSRRIDGNEAARLGLVNRLCPGTEVAAAATEYFVELAARCSPASIATMKRQVYQQLHAGLGPAEREAIDLMDEALAAEDFTEGVSAFVEHRAPVFKRLGDHSAANQA